MYRLFVMLKDRSEPPTEEERAIAAGKRAIDPAAATAYLGQLEHPSASIISMFTKQQQQDFVSDIHTMIN